MTGDESYAGSRSFDRFESVVRDLTGYAHIIPTHQGRAAERILFASAVQAGQLVPNNTHFDTTRANVEFQGAEALDIPCADAADLQSDVPFKGNMDIDALRETLTKSRSQRAARDGDGHQQLGRRAARVARQPPRGARGVRRGRRPPLPRRRPLRRERVVHRRARARAGGAHAARRRRGDVPAGRRLHDQSEEGRPRQHRRACSRSTTASSRERCRDLLTLTEGFPTYGGLAGRDLEALSQGLLEITDPDYLRYRIRTAEYLAEKAWAAGVPTVRPPGGHAVYLDAGALLPHIPPHELPAQALACELYLEGGVRGVEIGTLMFGRPRDGQPDEPARHELVRLALPRRVYTQSHIDYVGEVIAEVAPRAPQLRGLRIVEQPAWLRHFTARLAPL